MEKSLLRVDILGTSLTIQSGDGREYLEQLVRFLREKLEEVRIESPNAHPLKISLIASLNIIDELFKEQNGSANGKVEEFERASEITEKLILKIDQCLSDDERSISCGSS